MIRWKVNITEYKIGDNEWKPVSAQIVDLPKEVDEQICKELSSSSNKDKIKYRVRTYIPEKRPRSRPKNK